MKDFSKYEADFPETSGQWWHKRRSRVPLRVKTYYKDMVKALSENDETQAHMRKRANQVQAKHSGVAEPKIVSHQVHVRGQAIVGGKKAHFIEYKHSKVKDVLKAIDRLIHVIEYGRDRTVTPRMGNIRERYVHLGGVEDRCPNLLAALHNVREIFDPDPEKGNPIPPAYRV